ncbi:hypothetical protein MMC21_004923 [Puttea exsequens]|nr:hypothetical protein [Puttea exsequens]
MHAVQVTNWGEVPKYTELPTTPSPAPDSGLVQIKVLATGLHRLVKSRAAGQHYSVKKLPHIPGTDGVGETSDGTKVYFSAFPEQIGGSFRDVVTVPKRMLFPLPQGADLVQVASKVNPALSSWMALRNRCENLPERFTVLVLGATSASGQIAVHFAKYLGAGKVVAVARNEAALKKLGADETVVLKDKVEDIDYSSVGKVDVILDYVYGAPAVHLLTTLKTTARLQYVHIGSLAGLEIQLDGAVLRSKDLVMRGSGPGAFTMEAILKEMPSIIEAVTKLPEQKIEVVKLSEVEKNWEESGARKVFVP